MPKINFSEIKTPYLKALELNKLLNKSDRIKDLKEVDEKMLKSYISVPLSEKFGVSQECMEIILGEKNTPLIKF